MEDTAPISDSCGCRPGLESSLVSWELWVWIIGVDDEIAMFQEDYGENFVEMGTGRVLTFAAARQAPFTAAGR